MVGESDWELFGFIGLRVIHPAGSYRAYSLKRFIQAAIQSLFSPVLLRMESLVRHHDVLPRRVWFHRISVH